MYNRQEIDNELTFVFLSLDNKMKKELIKGKKLKSIILENSFYFKIK